MTPETSRLYRPDIDGLRAVAVLSVVFTHLGIFFRGGYVGVDVFFVISGFLITRLIRKDLEAGTFSLVEFWERRVRRILPALAVMALATVIVGWFLLLPVAYADVGRSLGALSLFVANFHFWLDQDYFAAANGDKPLLHTWSLAVEEQFYLLLPLFLGFLGVRGKLKQALPWLMALTLGSLALSIVGTSRSPTVTFYLLPTRAWELFAGALLALMAPRAAPAPSRKLDLLSLVGLLLVLAPVPCYERTTPFPGIAALPPVLGAALLIWSGSTGTVMPLANRWLSARGMVAIGLWSYSIYLWHWPLLVFFRSQSIGRPTHLEKALLLATALVLGYLSYRWVETPFRQRRLLGTRRSLFGAAAGAVVVMLGAGAGVFQSGGFPGRMPPEVHPILASIERSPRFITRPRPEDVPERLKRFGAPGGPEALAVWGDSHAMVLLPEFERLAAQRGLRVVATTRPATAPLDGYYGSGDSDKQRFNAAVLQYLRHSRIRTVFMTAIWADYRGPRFRTALHSTVGALRRAGIRVFLMHDVPRYPFEVPRALVVRMRNRQDVSDLSISVEHYRNDNRAPMRWFAELEGPAVTLLDPVPLMRARTGSERLIPFDAGGSFYVDSMHLSHYGAAVLRPLVTQVLEGIPKGSAR